ncbi:amidase signature domain-containing protein [Nemania abortiva]|nr:amidase signature domain-containing protein [Nemania abortiva]
MATQMPLKSPEITHTEDGLLFSASGNNYIAPKNPSIATVPSLRNVGLITVFRVPPDKIPQVSGEWIRSRVERYLAEDDVFNTSFLKTVVFCGLEGDGELSNDASEYLSHLGNERVVFLSKPYLLPGPYACWGEEIRDVWKLVDDSNGTCMATLKPQERGHDDFELFSIKNPGSQFHSFALPSRIKTDVTFPSILSRLRVVIKDSIGLKGIKNSLGNRAFYNTCDPKTKSAACAQSIVDLGMVIVGKTKMTSFGSWEEPVECIEYQAPWNPRGDGYQSPGGSSSGSAAAIASYDWLDIAIGTDTWGSVIRPSLWCGCFGFRPSWGSLSADGIEPSCRSWDTAGVLARDLEKCRHFSSLWLSPDMLKDNPVPFTSIIWPTDYWSVIDPSQIEIAKGFVKKVKAVLDIECDEVSFEAIWRKSPPSDAKGLSLGDYINEATNMRNYDAYHNLDDFRAKHLELFGHPPYVTPSNQQMWWVDLESYAQGISEEERDKAFAKIEVYKEWLTETIFTGTGSNALVIMPLESMTPRYRDEVPTFRRPPQDGITALTLAPTMSAPVLSVPIAEIPYHSHITDREEMLPFVVAIMGLAGTDIGLMDEVLKVMKESDMPTVVKTGRSMFK